MFRVFNLECLGLILALSLATLGACEKKERRDKAMAPEGALAPYVPSSWTLDRDWVGSGLKIKDIRP